MAEYNRELNAGIPTAEKNMINLGTRSRVALKNSIGSTDSIGREVGSGLERGIGSKIGDVVAAATRLAVGITGTLRNLLRTGSPSRAAIEIGGFVVEGLADGITKNIGLIEKASKLAADAIDIQPDIGAFDPRFITGQGGPVYSQETRNINYSPTFISPERQSYAEQQREFEKWTRTVALEGLI